MSPTFLERITPHPPRPPKESHSRAGRNLPAAVATALTLLTIVGLSLAFKIEVFVGLVAIALVLGLWEATGAFLNRDIHIPIIPLAAGAIAIVVSTWKWGIGIGLVAFLVAGLVVFGWTLLSGRRVSDASAATFALGWIALSGAFAVALAALPDGAKVIVAFIMLPVANDTGGWLFGILWGKHPIAPKISPKKSWEGFVGSVLATLLLSWLTVGLMLSHEWYWVVLFGLLTPVVATAGDFAESLLKRDLGVKDMGSIFPGHGGMLDRIDSLLFCAPTFYFIFALALGLL